MKRRLLIGCALAVVIAALAGCGGSSKPSAAELLMQKQATLYQIDQIERAWHRAGSTHNVNLIMSLFAPGAVFNLGTKTFTGKAQIRKFFATENPAFKAQNHWLDDTPTFKMRVTVNGDKGTLYFQCHYIDVKTGKVMSVVGVDHQVQRIDGKWLIVDAAGSTAVLSQ